jgi:hypothetical protein
MEPVVVLAPPRAAYNPNRRVSDLLLSQLKHFQHVELKRGDLGIDAEIARNIHTEAGAALYIAAVTKALRKTTRAAQPPKLTVMPAPPAIERSTTEAFAIAAAADAVTDTGTGELPPALKPAPRSAAKKNRKRKP